MAMIDLENILAAKSNGRISYTADVTRKGEKIATVSSNGGKDSFDVIDKAAWNRIVERPSDLRDVRALCLGQVKRHLGLPLV